MYRIVQTTSYNQVCYQAIGVHRPHALLSSPPPPNTPVPSIPVSYVDYASVYSMQLSRLTTASSNSLAGVLSSFCKVAMLNLSSLPVFLNRKRYRETGSWSACSRSYKKKERKSNHESATMSCPKRSSKGMRVRGKEGMGWGCGLDALLLKTEINNNI